MKKYKKVVNILTGLFTIILFVWMCISFVKVPSNENKELLMKYCDEVAYTFIEGSVPEEYDVYVSTETEGFLLVKIKDETEYGIRAEYPMVNANFEGTTKTFEIDMENATYTEEIKGSLAYSTWGKASVIFVKIGTAFVASTLMGMACWVFLADIVTVIIARIVLIKEKKKDKENNN